MRAQRRFSQAISEGDGISLLAVVRTADAARAAEEEGAEGIVVDATLAGLDDATELPVLWSAPSVAAARGAGAHACLLVVEGLEDEDGRLEGRYSEARELGLECVVVVGDEDELRLALDRLDPEIVLLSGRRPGRGEALERVLALLPDVPAGKLAVADLELRSREEVAGLERAGVDAVIVAAEAVSTLIAEPQPEP
jgi:indole-3-glycerol phosphate synthase